ncbi:MAG: hypothetical protein GF308_01605 [Candidatus Heimdallarchaeota archaeon]|nr:hypothetical protein [Candidatus Heimdallarchaeota archaeon]
MTIIFSQKLQNQLKQIIQKKKEKQIYFSVLIGSIDSENDQISLIAAKHYIQTKDKKSDLKLSNKELLFIQTLQKMLPLKLSVVGVMFFTPEITKNELELIGRNIKKIKSLALLAHTTKDSLNIYSITKTELAKLDFEIREIPNNKMIEFIHTVEVEIPEQMKDEELELKKALITGLEKFWDKISFSKPKDTQIKTIFREERAIDRIIEINVPCELKDFASRTKPGMIFLAIDLHVHLYPNKGLMEKTLLDMKELLKQGMIKDLSMKLQRASFDWEEKEIVTPWKLPLSSFGLQLFVYPQKDKISKYEYETCSKFIEFAKFMASIDYQTPARVLLRDLQKYFQTIEDEEKEQQIDKLVLEVS